MATQEELLQQTEAARDLAITAKNQAESASTTAQLANVNAQNAASAAGQSAVDSEYSRGLTIDARDAAVVARNEATSARSTVLTKAAEVSSNAALALQAANSTAGSVTKASQWADNPRDQLVPGESSYSARHWAEAAAEAASGVTGDIIFLGPWDAAVSGTPPTPSQAVRYLIVSDGIVGGKQVYDGDYIIYDVASSVWLVTSNANRIAAVNGYDSGNVTLDYGDFAGAQHIVLDNAVQIQGRTATTGTYAIGRVGSDNRIRLGDENSAGLALQSPSVPYWTDGATSRTLVHTAGGQYVAGMYFTQSVSLDNGKGFYGKKVDGTWSLLSTVSTGNVTVFGSADLPAELRSSTVPLWRDGSGTTQLLHAKGGQTVAGDVTIQGSGTIAAADFNSGWLKIGNATTGWAFDSNEIFSTGTATIGTLAGNLNLTPVGNLVINGAATTVNNAMTVNGTLTLGDAQTIRMGASNDLQLQHNGTHSYLDNYTGALYLRQLDQTQIFALQVRDTGGTVRTVAQCQGNTANPYFRAMYGGTEKMRTVSTGLQVYDTLTATDVALSGGGTFGADIVSNTQNAGIQFNYVANAATPAYDSAGSSITGGADFAGLGKRNNIDVQTWYGFSVSPTYGSGAVARGTPAFSVDARSGISYMANGLYIAGGAAWHSGNFNPSDYLTTGGKAADSELLDGIDSSRFVYGAGAPATTQLSSSWDEPAKSGFYDGDGKTNAPTASGWYWGLFASHSNAGSYGWSLVTNNSTNPTMYMRGKAASSWGSWNTVMTSNLSSYTFGGQLILSKSGSSDNIRVGDDVWLGDGNKANTVFVKGNQNSDRGFIIFGSSTSNNQLGAIGTGDLTWGGNTVWHAGNVATKGSIPAANNSSTAGTGFGGFRYTISGSTLNLFTT